ncbi:hypothetical protein BCON_0257g00170 [Botryotinia convoluta]|uniref:Cytochrome P450 n=1 Tax=Botryotinia convoluta TaxID=54673 RepID=A0A4Z1HGK6_9HELO|nr:hypothetical protein BCON_0257g00170 [Botryotinia convoluta]
MSLLFASLAASVSFVWFLNYVFVVKRDFNEPPYIHPKFPIIGHAANAIATASERYKLRIFGLAILGMPGGRVYVIISPDLVLAVQRQSKQLSFWHVEATFTVGMAGLSLHAAKIITHNVHGEEEGTSFFKSSMTLHHQELQPGEHLLNITRDGTQKLTRAVSKLEEMTRIDLNQWIVDVIMDSVTGSFYGPKNPYKDPEVSRAFKTLKTMPSRKDGRCISQILWDEGPKNASHIIQSKDKAAATSEISLLDRARMDAVSGHVILANTTPTAFWTVFHLLSDPKLVEEVRNAVEPLVKTVEKDGRFSREMDISKIRDVPIIKSILHESLRHYADGTGTRIVLQDTMLDEKYLLKKDSFIFMPNRAYHFDESSWGSDVCGFDVEPVGGTWVYPGADSSNLSLIINPPIKEVLVDFKPRAGWANCDWSFTL